MALNIHSDDWVHNLNTNSLNISNLKIGNIVKISNNFEKFWVKIIDKNDNYILGKIDNYLTFNKTYDYQDIVLFEENNILDFHNKQHSEILHFHIKTKCKVKDFK